jgi:glutamate formiminotransferase / 5-formyltetrahydrofolate cyclo-ligase
VWLGSAPLTGERAPDLGPSMLPPPAGAVAVGARGPLLAYNVDLDTADVRIARRIARRVRERDGGLPGVKALGLWLDAQRRAQVSFNVTRPDEVGLAQVFDRVAEEARREGVEVTSSELIGGLRLAELLDVARHYLRLRELSPAQVLDLWAARLEATAEAREGDDGRQQA